MNNKLELKDNFPLWIYDTIENDLQRIYDHFRYIKSENEYLIEENKNLKSESYKDIELSKMKSEYDKMKEDYYRGFPISDEEEKKINEWKKTLPKQYTGVIEARFVYHFNPTSIGIIGGIEDTVTGKKFTFRELS